MTETMHNTGIVRSADELGRIVIPRSIREQMGIKEGAKFEVLTTKSGDIIFRKYDAEAVNITVGCIPVQEVPRTFRVIYYTAQGSRTKDFGNDSAAANAFYARHVKNHPEYQNHSWSKTEIIALDVQPTAIPVCEEVR